jgi:hypothetical protein
MGPEAESGWLGFVGIHNSPGVATIIYLEFLFCGWLEA